MSKSKRRNQQGPSFGFGKPKWQKDSKDFELEVEPDYPSLVDLYLSEGTAGLMPAILDWLVESGQIYHEEPTSALLNRVNQVSMTVYDIASKQAQNLASRDLKLAEFTLKIPMEPDDFISYLPVQKNRLLATEAMRLINTGFFDSAITFLINVEGDAVQTLRKYGVILYMGTNSNYEIIDAACALASWKPFEVFTYAGEQRSSLNPIIFKTFSPLINQIQNFRIQQKGANKFPCLSLLTLVENKASGAICEFRKHYTAQGGNQLIIPGYSSGGNNSFSIYTKMNVLGKPAKIPDIRGFNHKIIDGEKT
ncbi:hypothetical protein [Limnospira platensis]|uniref:hypothetical protein n=1 Tax=Limnospira platensis TaxID=118562 RepID=UPI003D6FF661